MIKNNKYGRLSSFVLVLMVCRIGALVAHEFLVTSAAHKRQHVGRWRRAAAQGMAETIKSASKTVSALGDLQTALCRPACEYVMKGKASALMRVTSSEQLAELCKKLRRVRHAMRQLEREARQLTCMSEAAYESEGCVKECI